MRSVLKIELIFFSGKYGSQAFGYLQPDFNGFSLRGHFFIQSKEYQGSFGISSFDVQNGSFHNIKMDQDFLYILGACHVTFETESLVFKIGGYLGRHLFDFGHKPNHHPALNTTTILKFSQGNSQFSEFSALKVCINYFV